MATKKKNNTKKENNKPETIEVEETIAVEETAEDNKPETYEDMMEILKKTLIENGLDEEQVNAFFNQNFNNDVEAVEPETKESFKEKAKAFKEKTKDKVSEHKESLKTAGIFVATFATITGVCVAVCNMSDDEEDVVNNDVVEDTVDNEPYEEVIKTTEGDIKITMEMVNDEA